MINSRASDDDGKRRTALRSLVSMTSAKPTGRIFYGWKIVGAAFGLQFMQAAFIHQAFGAYVAILRETFGWSKTALSAAAAIQQLEGALLGPVQGWISDRFGPRSVLRFGLIFFGAGMMLLSQVESLTVFYLSFVLIALGTSFGGFFPLTIALVHWFEKKRARALSVLTLGFAIGGMVVPIVAWSMTTFGWRWTAFGSGVLSIVIGFPLAGMIRNQPRDMGEHVDGIPPEPAPTTTVDERDAAASSGPPTMNAPVPDGSLDFSWQEALRTPAFWLISLGHGFALLVIGAINVHAIIHMKEGLGYSIEQAALIISLQTVAQVGGIMLGWVLGDRYEKRLLCASCMAAHMVGLLLLAYATSLPMLIAFALLNGVAWGLRGPFMQAMRADYFGRRSIGMIMGLSSIVVVVGQIGGPLFAGIMADATGNYRIGFTVLGLLAGLGTAFFIFAVKPPLPARRTPASP